MGCIMTPMPNHLSTLKPHKEVWRTPLQNNKTTQRSVGIRKRGSVGMEQMRSGVGMMRKNKRKENRWTLPERY